LEKWAVSKIDGKIMKNIPVFFSACLWVSGAVSANTVLIHNDFDGLSDDIGPAFQQLSNGNGGGSADPATGVVLCGGMSETGDGAWGLNSVRTIDVSGANGFTVEWVVDRFSGDHHDILFNGFFFGVVAGSAATATDADALFNNEPAAIGIHLFEKHIAYKSQMNILQDPEGGGTHAIAETSLGGATPTLASMRDGFSLRFTLNSDNTWSASSAGLSPDFNATGSLQEKEGAPLYADLADGLGIYSSIQGANVGYTLHSVSLTAGSGATISAPPIYEPGTLGLITAFGGGVVLVCRRPLI
jgi:hypothetical protein